MTSELKNRLAGNGLPVWTPYYRAMKGQVSSDQRLYITDMRIAIDQPLWAIRNAVRPRWRERI
jgi:hypothetical protein